MKMLDFRSALAEPTTNFVRYKRGLNRKYVTEAALRRLFDRYLNERRVRLEIYPSPLDRDWNLFFPS